MRLQGKYEGYPNISMYRTPMGKATDQHVHEYFEGLTVSAKALSRGVKIMGLVAGNMLSRADFLVVNHQPHRSPWSFE